MGQFPEYEPGAIFQCGQGCGKFRRDRCGVFRGRLHRHQCRYVGTLRYVPAEAGRAAVARKEQE